MTSFQTAATGAGVEVRALTADDCDAYAVFRNEMWPTHAAAGDWETARWKYHHNPHAAACPGSGLYGSLLGGSLVGVMGAYPMPVTLDGVVHPGHMLVDWAILPRFQNGPIAGRLFETLVGLPGRKFASTGTRASQAALARRAVQLTSVEAIVLVRPLQAALVRALRLVPYAQASPRCAEPIRLEGRAEVVPLEEVRPAEPAAPAGTAYVFRGPDFWRAYATRRLQNGALALRLSATDAQADVVLRILEVGRWRFSVLLAVRMAPAAADAAGALGRSLRAALGRLGVCGMAATEADPLLRTLLRASGVHVLRRASRWWSIPKRSDAFAADEVRWWLTSADRDSHWGYVQPGLAAR